MPITDYKVTDIERDAVRMQGKADPLQGTLAQNQAEFDEYPELVRDNLDGLCDYVATMPISYLSSAAAATANKGSMTGFVPLGAILEISMTNGNTSANPTISIDGVTHTFTNMPTTAQVQSNSTQVYRFIKTGATVLTYTTIPDYVTEYGTRASGYPYKKYASGLGNIDGDTYNPTVTSGAGTLTSYTATGSYIKIGKKVTFHFRIDITNVGTGSQGLVVTLPIQPTVRACGSAVENNAVGFIAWVDVDPANAFCIVKKYDNSATLATNYRFSGSVTYTVA